MARNTDIPTEEELYDLAELFKVFGDSTRIRILFQLFDKELSVGELADLLNMNQSAVSHQLKVLKQAKLVKNRRHHDHLENEESGEALEYGIQTFVYYRRPAMSLARFDEFVSTQWPKSVIRAKGMCYFRDEPDTCYLFEQSGKQFNITNAGQWFASMPAEELEQFMEQNPNAKNDWDENYGDRMQKIVFIGKDMDRKAIEALLDACLED